MAFLLAADIGATNSRFAIFQICAAPDETEESGICGVNGALQLLREHWFATADYGSFPELLAALAALPGPFIPQGTGLACLAPAGPITGDTCRPPNIPWTIHTQDVTAALGIGAVHLINDFVAQGYACAFALTDEHARLALDVRDITPHEKTAHAPVAVIGAGTGCGKALVLPPADTRDDVCPDPRPQLRAGTWQVLPSEGGHGDFPFVGEDEYAFASFVRKRTGKARIIGDMILSGEGLTHLFAFHTGQTLSPIAIGSLLASPADSAHETVLAWFARLYARVCRNFILDTLALGGLCITSGMALRVPVLGHSAFLMELRGGQTRQDLLATLPVWHIRSQQAGLWGAAFYGTFVKGAYATL